VFVFVRTAAVRDWNAATVLTLDDDDTAKTHAATNADGYEIGLIVVVDDEIVTDGVVVVVVA
jgi:hypothetical protein